MINEPPSVLHGFIFVSSTSSNKKITAHFRNTFTIVTPFEVVAFNLKCTNHF